MKLTLSNLWVRVQKTPLAPGLILLGAALWGGWYVSFSSKLDSALALWAWGLAILIPFYAGDFSSSQCRSKTSQVIAWCFLVLGALLVFEAQKMGAIALLLIAGVFFFGNVRLGIYASGAILVWIVALPQAEYLQHLISYPMRLVGAEVSAVALSLCGFDASAAQTGVDMGGRVIAITAACSGIEQLEAMLLVGWIVSFSMQKNLSYQLLHFMTLLPAILLANTLRITVTLVGVKMVGDVFLGDTLHTLLGYGMVILSILFFIGVGSLFPQDEPKKTAHE